MTVEVVDQRGQPLGNVEVTASWSGGSAGATTAGNGKVFLDVPAGTQVQLDIDHPAYVRNRPRVVAAAEETDYTLEVHRKGSLALTVESPGGAVTDAEVVMQKDGRAVVDRTTNARGTAESGPIEFGNYTLVVRKPGFPVTRQTVVVNDDLSETVEIESASVTLEFRVTDDTFAPARPVTGATVAVREAGSVRTLENGEATASVPVNSWVSYAVTKEGYRNQTGEVFVEETPDRVNVTVQRIPAVNMSASNERIVVGESVTVTVRNEYGEPLSGAAVSVDGEPVGETNGEGQLAVTIDGAGEHTIAARNGQAAARIRVTGVEAATSPPPETPTPASETESNDPLPFDVETPGFTAVLALVALLGAAALARVRRG